MASVDRSAKSGNDWTADDLRAYNVTIEAQDFETFFGQPSPSLLPSELLTKQRAADMTNVENYRIISFMDLAMNRVPNEESKVAQFTEKLLAALEYESLARSVVLQQQMPLFICGESRHATADVCIVDMSEILLVGQEDKRHMDAGDPDPQLISVAIAAFQFNNYKRTQVLNEPALTSKVIAGITMLGTAPTFFKIPVTQDLVSAVETGQYPAAPTIVSMHVPEIPRPTCRIAEGMEPLDNREAIFACFEAFKQFV
jgi:hypothetical protein